MKKPKLHKFGKMGFNQAFTYLMDLLCYSYYVKSNNLVLDRTFDDLEKLYCEIFQVKTCPSRAMEREACYSAGVKVVYNYLMKLRKK